MLSRAAPLQRPLRDPNNEGDIFLRPSLMVMSVSFVVLTLVGVTSGFWPALKAARMNPIEALRYE